jgi:predicted dienelactone hydrolase
VKKMRKMIFSLMISTCAFGAIAAKAADVGFSSFKVEDEARRRVIESLVWYPAGAGGTDFKVGDNPLFQGVPVMKGAAVGTGTYPVVVISHGSGGNAANLGWLAKKLAEEGFIVVAPNHPGTTSGDSRPAETALVWNRPMDLSVVLTGLLRNAEFGLHVDQKHINLVGFSLGGYAVLAAAGARADAAAFANYCDTNKEPMSECKWFAKGHVDLHKVDAEKFNQDNFDARFTSVVAIDPALVKAYQGYSLGEMKVPALLINLGAVGKIPMGVDASVIAKAIPNAQHHNVVDAIHFSFLGLCKANWKDVLAAEADADPLCDDGGGRSRAEIHDEIFGRMLGFLKSKLTN